MFKDRWVGLVSGRFKASSQPVSWLHTCNIMRRQTKALFQPIPWRQSFSPNRCKHPVFSTHLPLYHSISLYLYVAIISILSIYLRIYIYHLRPMHVPRPYIPVYICRDVQRDTERSRLTWRDLNRYRKPFIETCVGIPVFIYPSMYPSIPYFCLHFCTLYDHTLVSICEAKGWKYMQRET